MLQEVNKVSAEDDKRIITETEYISKRMAITD